jgi:hypothetical protein
MWIQIGETWINLERVESIEFRHDDKDGTVCANLISGNEYHYADDQDTVQKLVRYVQQNEFK